MKRTVFVETECSM